MKSEALSSIAPGIELFTAQGFSLLVATALAHVFIFGLMLYPFYFWFTALERKVGADVQARVGPTFSGAAGLFQSIADQVKLVIKRKNNFEFPILSIVMLGLLFLQVGTIPFTRELVFIRTEVSPFLFLWFVFLFNFSFWFYGTKSRLVRDEVVLNRWMIQTIAGLMPAGIATFSALVGLTNFDWASILSRQGFYPWQWRIFASPFEFVNFFIFILAGALTTSSCSFSQAFTVVSAQRNSAHLPGVRFFVLANFVTVGVILFLGGSLLPGFILESQWAIENPLLLQLLSWVVLMAKVMTVLSGLFVAERVLPQLSSRQATRFGFHFLLPLSILVYIGALVWRIFD